MAKNGRQKKNQNKSKKKKNKVKTKNTKDENHDSSLSEEGVAEEVTASSSNGDSRTSNKGPIIFQNELSTDENLDESPDEFFGEIDEDLIEKYIRSAEGQRDVGKSIYLSDLPEKFSVPNAPLFTKKHVSLTQCNVCGSFSGNAVLSSCKHKYCRNCVRLSRTGRTVYCHYCRKQLPASTLEASEDFLEKMTVQCRCGLEATLGDIKKHLMPSNGRCKQSTLCVKFLFELSRHNKLKMWAERCNYLLHKVKMKRKDVKPPEDNLDFFKKVPVQPHLPYVYLDMEADGLFLGRIFIELRPDVVPETSENFIELCTSANGLTGCFVNSVVPHTMFETGTLLGSKTSTGVRPIFPDENFELKHDRPGALSMANFGPNTNSSEFCITAIPTPWRDGNHVVFGYVVLGIHIVHRICITSTPDGYPRRRIRICNSGLISKREITASSDSDDD